MSWKNTTQWQDSKSGKECVMCKALLSKNQSLDLTIANLKQTVAYVARNQAHYGTLIVVLKRHAIELFNLTTEELNTFWQEVALVAKAANQVFKPVKLNYGVFGNLCPHIHCHIFSRQKNEEPLPPTKKREPVYLSEEEYKEMVNKIKTALNTFD